MTATNLAFPDKPRIQLEDASAALTTSFPLVGPSEQLAQLLSDIDTLTASYDDKLLANFWIG